LLRKTMDVIRVSTILRRSRDAVFEPHIHMHDSSAYDLTAGG